MLLEPISLEVRVGRLRVRVEASATADDGRFQFVKLGTLDFPPETESRSGFDPPNNSENAPDRQNWIATHRFIGVRKLDPCLTGGYAKAAETPAMADASARMDRNARFVSVVSPAGIGHSKRRRW